ncbi:MAG: hypothetical protein FJZ92_09405 [Chloroflexi bacterium]|nr:hypothetical protein [Chloroflexota bacterium]MBM4269705.1 hypothetical protein [Deltaproteobacteria bacterium]
MRYAHAVLVAALALLTAIVPIGCGEDDQPSDPTGTPTPTATATPVPRISAITILPAFTGAAGLDVGASDDGFLVAYGGNATTTTTGIFGLRVDPDGTVLDRSPFDISVAQSDGFLANPSWTDPAVAFDGASYAVAYAGTGTAEAGIPAAAITAVLVDPQANVGPPEDLAETAQIGTCETDVVPPPAIAGSSASFAALWPIEEGCAGGPVLERLGGAFATVNGAGLDVTAIDGLLPPPGDQSIVTASAASVASNGTTTVATWTERVNQQNEGSLEVGVLSSSGVERVTLAPIVGGFVRPAIASDGADYLVVWQSTLLGGEGGGMNTIVGARFRPGTGPLDGAPFLIARGDLRQGAPRLAFGAGRYLVAWTVPAGGGVNDLQIAEVSPAGTPAAVETVATGLSSEEIALAFSGDAFLVTLLRAADAGAASLQGLLIRP